MRTPVRAVLESARRYVSADLATAAALDTLLEAAAHLPDVAASVGFECRLAADPRLDLGLSVERDGGAPALAAASVDSEQAAWRSIASFAAEWSRTGGALHAWVPFLFLEVDAPAAAVPIPSIFVALDWPLLEAHPEPAAQSEAAAPVLAAALRAVDLLLDAPCAETRKAIEDCLRRLPVHGRLLHVGVMLGRPGAPVRVSAAIPRRALRSYLAGVDRAQGIAELEALLDATFHHLPRTYPWQPVQADFDVGPAAGMGLGLTLRPETPAHWLGLLDDLGTAGLCLPQKRDALLAWPGRARVAIGAPCWLERYLSHVKLAWTPSAPLAAKAYFGATPRFARP